MKEILITSSVLILAVILLRLVFRGKVSQKLIYGAWLLVALRLLVPIQFGSFDFSVLNQAEPVTEIITEVSRNPVAGPSREEVYQQIAQDYLDRGEHIFIPEVEEKLEGSEPPSYEEILQEYPVQDIVIPEVNTQIEQEVETAITAPTIGQIATGVWIAGMAAMALWFIWVNFRFHRALRRSAVPMEVPGSPVPVKVDAALPSPCLFGFFRPTVYLTPVCTEDETHLRHVLTHELTHYAHKDHIWSLVRCVCLCVYWFDPLVWIAAGLAKRDCELACDEAVLKKLGDEERIAYGRTLVDMVASSTSPAHYLETATAMYETKKALKERVNHIMKKHKHLFISALSLILVLFIATGCVFTGANLPTGPDPTEPPETSSPPETTVPPTTSPSPTRQELDALTHTIGDAFVALGKTTEADYEDPAEYQRVRSFISNIVGWEALHSEKVVRINFKILNDSSISVFRKYILDSEFIRFQDLIGNYAPRTDPEYENISYDSVTNASDGLEFTLSTDGTYYLLTGIGTCTDTEIVIPSEKDGLPVRAIRYWAFVDQTGITSVTVPNSVLCIESAAFSNCTELASVKLPDTLQSIGAYAFSNCEKLSDITLPASATNLGEGLFYGCTGLTSMELPQSIRSVSNGMFYGCTGLVSVTIPDSVTSIGSTAFYECTSLTEIRIPASVRSIGNLTFAGCVDLELYYADTIQRWNSIIKEDSLSRPVHCTDGDVGPFSELVEKAQHWSELSNPDDVTKLGADLLDIFLSSPENFAATLTEYDNESLYHVFSCITISLRNDYRFDEVQSAVRSLDLLSLSEHQKRHIYQIVFNTETAETMKINDISTFDYALHFDLFRYADGWVGPFYETQVAEAFSLDPAGYIRALAKEPEADWENLIRRLASAHQYDADGFTSFQNTLSGIAETVTTQAEKDVIAATLSRCQNLSN